MVTCTTDQEPIDGKISAAHRVWFETMSGAMTVIIGAEGGAKVCPLPDCSVRPCAERDAFLDRWQAENLASQRCIRDLIVSIGGTADATAFLGNSFAAMLTWEQIQVVAAHPHVTSVEANIPTPPP